MNRQRPRIVHVIGAQLGGAEKQLVGLLEQAAPRFEHQVLLVRGGPLAHRFGELATTHDLDKGAGLDPRFYARLVRNLRRLKPDLVHAWTETPALWVPSAARISGVPATVVSEVALQEWKQGLHLLADRVNYLLTATTVANAQAVADSAIRRGARAAKTRVIHLGVDLPGAPILERDSNVVLLLARFDYRKGHDTLLKAVPRILDAVPDVRVVMAGPAGTDEELATRQDVVAAIERSGLADVIDLPGSVNPVPLLKSAAVLAIPSHSEGLPNVVMEAMAYGLPVVATRVGGIPEIVADGVTGWLVDVGDAEQLATAIIEALTHTAEARKRAATARHLAETLSMSKSMERWESLYDELLGAPAVTS